MLSALGKIHGLILVFFLNISLSLDSGYHVLYLYARDVGSERRAASVRLMGPKVVMFISSNLLTLSLALRSEPLSHCTDSGFDSSSNCAHSRPRS